MTNGSPLWDTVWWLYLAAMASSIPFQVVMAIDSRRERAGKALTGDALAKLAAASLVLSGLALMAATLLAVIGLGVRLDKATP